MKGLSANLLIAAFPFVLVATEFFLGIVLLITKLDSHYYKKIFKKK